jgi:hypothetical protein
MEGRNQKRLHRSGRIEADLVTDRDAKFMGYGRGSPASTQLRRPLTVRFDVFSNL